MVSWIRAVLTVALVCGAASGAARGEASLPSGEEIMRRVDARPRGKNHASDQHLVAADGSERLCGG